MHFIFVSDIFGRTKALERMVFALTNSCEIFDPYNSRVMDFQNEQEAYRYFSSQITIEQYANELVELVTSLGKPVTLIGFSAGASAIWKASAMDKLENAISALCFYGGQIRFDKEIKPRFLTQLIFPAQEEHFCVAKLITELSNKQNVTIQQVEYLHGFMNEHSLNYDEAGYQLVMTALRHFVLSGNTLQNFNI